MFDKVQALGGVSWGDCFAIPPGAARSDQPYFLSRHRLKRVTPGSGAPFLIHSTSWDVDSGREGPYTRQLETAMAHAANGHAVAQKLSMPFLVPSTVEARRAVVVFRPRLM